MGENKNLLLASIHSHMCGIIFDPIAEENIEIHKTCEDSECECNLDTNPENQGIHVFHLGACGIILDYLL